MRSLIRIWTVMTGSAYHPGADWDASLHAAIQSSTCMYICTYIPYIPYTSDIYTYILTCMHACMHTYV